MKKIKIFLASSIVDLELDRIQVGDFIRQLNEIYFDRGIHFTLVKCDDYDNTIVSGGKQAEFDREIRDSELCFFLFFRKVGDYTRHEFEIALQSYKNMGKPKIVTYFKYVTNPENATDEVKAFMKMLDGEIKHYYNVYQSIDTLKLGILMQIKLMQLDAEEPHIENGKVIFGNSEVADISQIPLFTGNQTLNLLRENLVKLTEKYLDLRQRSIGNPEDEALYSQFADVAKQKSDVEDKIRLTEKAVLETSKIMLEKTAKGNLSPRQVAAYHALDQGDYSSALEILDLNAIMLELEHNEEMAEGYLERIQINVDELLQRTEVLQAEGITQDNAVEIRSIYETICERIEKYNLSKAPLLDFVIFLYNQNDSSTALTVAKQLEYYYHDPKESISLEKQARLYSMLGAIYHQSRHYIEAEQMYKKGQEIYQQLAETNQDAFLPNLAVVYSDIAVLYASQQNFAPAEKALLEALAIQKKLAEKNPNLFTHQLANIYANLGYLYFTNKRLDKPEYYYLESLKLCEKQIDKNPAYELLMAHTLNNLGLLYYVLQRWDEAIQSSLRAKDIYVKLANQNPDAYEDTLINCYINLGNTFLAIKESARAIEYLTKSSIIAYRLANKNLEVFGALSAFAFANLGHLFMSANFDDKAEEVLLNAVKIYEELLNKNPCSYDINWTLAYNQLGELYLKLQRYDEAVLMLCRSADIYEKYVAINFDEVAPSLAKCYRDLEDACSHLDNIEQDQAGKILLKEVEIYKYLAEKLPNEYEPELALACFKVGIWYKMLMENEEDLWMMLTEHEKSEYYLAQAYKLACKYKDNSICEPIYSSLKNMFQN